MTLSGNAIIKAFQFIPNSGMAITGTTKCFGFMEWAGMEGKTVNSGTFTSFVSFENINDPFYGASRTEIPTGVTNPIQTNWIA